VPRTLAFLRRGDEVLLLRRSEDARILPRTYNGVGGHVEAGEDVHSAVAREIREETGLAARDLRLRGVLHVTENDAAVGVMVFVFTGEAEGEPSPVTGEGTPLWVSLSEIARLDVVPDLPAILARLWPGGEVGPFLAGSEPGAPGAMRFAAP
jgi:8-oxo-dGTP diphosphatase